MSESVAGRTAVDVVVVGSGGGALVAACRAADRGLEVLVIESSERLGGTTAVSGGVLWTPTHHLMHELGVEDSADEAMSYLRAATRGTTPEHRIEWFVRTAPRTARYLADQTRVRFTPIKRLDYHPELPGAKLGRSLDNLPFDVRGHEGLEKRLRVPTYFPPMTIVERDLWQGAKPDTEVLERRKREGVRTLGGALIGALILSAEDRGVVIRTRARAHELMVEHGAVRGVEVESDHGRQQIVARRGILLACGGFEWSPTLQAAFLRAPVTPISPPSNTGGGIVMALRAGAGLQQMTRIWGMPVMQDPAHVYDGEPSGRPANVQLTLPGAILVNRYGERFVNEARDYHDLTKTFFDEDVEQGGLRNQPAWMIFDDRYRRSYPLADRPAGAPAPDWVSSAASARQLAEDVGIDPAGLEQTLDSFNQGAESGDDPKFHRGRSAQDRHLGDKAHVPNPCLAPLEDPPFHAVPITPGALGTAGGLTADDVGRVLDIEGSPIPGLFAAGNVTSSIFGDTYPGAGATISASVMRGYAAGDAIAG